MQLTRISLRAGIASLICVLFFSGKGYTQLFEKKGNVIAYRGNHFEMSEDVTDTITITDPVNGQEMVEIVKRDPVPVKMNGDVIYKINEVATGGQSEQADSALEAYLINGLLPELKTLPDGAYGLDLSGIIIKEKGRVVFYKYGGLMYNGKPLPVEKVLIQKIDDLLLKAPPQPPARYKAASVLYMSGFSLYYTSIDVKNHKVVFKKK